MVDIVRAVAVHDVFVECRGPGVGVVLGPLLRGFELLDEVLQLLWVVSRVAEFQHSQVEYLLHVLFRTGDAEVAVVVAAVEAEGTAQAVHLDAELLRRHVAGTDGAEIAHCLVDVVVVERAVVVVDGEAEEVVLGVLRGVEVAVLSHGHGLYQFLVVEHLRLDVFHLAVGDMLGKLGLLTLVLSLEVVPVGLDALALGGESHVGAHDGAVVAVVVFGGNLHDVLAGDVHQAFVLALPFLILGARQFQAL